jgi:hypothetical protein
VLSGRIDGLKNREEGAELQFGALSGISTAVSETEEERITTLSPDEFLVATDLSVKLTKAPGGTIAVRSFETWINGSDLGAVGCRIENTETTCSSTFTVPVPPGSTLAIREIATPPGLGGPAPADALVGLHLTK